MGGYSVVLAVAALTTWALTPLVRRLSFRVHAVVRPDPRKVHELPTPTLGGLAMLGGVAAAMVVASRIPQFHAMFSGTAEPWGVLLAGVLIVGVGALDDLREVSPPGKIAGQVLSASVLAAMGVTMFHFRIPFLGIFVMPPDLAPLVTVLWVVLMANAVNLIDGLDGLATGIVLIAGGAFFLYADRLFDEGLLPGSNMGPLVAIIAVGVCAGFLPHNFHPAKIFMGDAGSLLLGLLMASTTIVVGGRTADQFSGQTYFFFAPLFIPFFILGVPLLDTAFAILRRSMKRTSFAVSDKEHLHHRLMRLGHGQRRSVMILWVWTLALSGLVLAPTYTNEGNALVPFGIAALGIFLYVLFHPGTRQTTDPNNGDPAPADPTAELDLGSK